MLQVGDERPPVLEAVVVVGLVVAALWTPVTNRPRSVAVAAPEAAAEVAAPATEPAKAIAPDEPPPPELAAAGRLGRIEERCVVDPALARVAAAAVAENGAKVTVLDVGGGE